MTLVISLNGNVLACKIIFDELIKGIIYIGNLNHIKVKKLLYGIE